MKEKNSRREDPIRCEGTIDPSVFEECFRSVDHPLAITDAQGLSIVRANPAFEQLSGRDSESLAELAADSLFEIEDATWQDLESREIPTRGQLIQKSGVRVPVEMSASRVGPPEDRHVMVSLRDLRPSLRSEELERSVAQMQRSQALGQMASGIAHDFNNVLMAVLPWSDLLRRKFGEEPAVAQATEHIRRAVHRARDVTRQLLEFAQPRPPQKEPTSLAALIRQQLKIIRPALPPGIEIDFVENDEGWVDADSAQIAQVILNLALNARDAMPAGGRLRFELRGLTQAEGERWSVEPAETLVLSISDSGDGIDGANIESIFNPFFTTKEHGRGPGLGLPVALRMVQQHGGAIYVDNRAGEGATFHVLLPRLERAQAEEEPRRGTAYSGITVMVVDDETPVLEGIAAILESEGLLVEAYDRGDVFMEALAKKGAPPDLVILDLGIPGISGEELHRRLRAKFPDVPILISTGYGDSERLDPLLGYSRTAFQQKPYDAETLFNAIDALLGLR
jgi:two-component system, cell cycle sensor histidine kinase and response regulator CckA